MWALTATISRRTHSSRHWLWALSLAAAVVAAGGAALAGDGHVGIPLTVTLITFFALMLPYAAFLSTSLARDIGVWLRSSTLGLAQVVYVFVGAYILYAVGTGSFTWDSMARVVFFVTVPTALVSSARGRTDVTWRDFVAIGCIWLPFDAGWLKDIWTWPDGGGAYILNTLMAVTLAVALFAGFRGFSRVTPRFQITLKDLRLVVLAFVAFLVMALPFGFLTGFVAWHPQLTALKVLVAPIGIFLFIALPEELLFRGLLQNFLERRLGRPWLALGLTAVLFGATHLNNGPAPDWRYFLLASIAGAFYGVLYQRTRGLTASALLHAAVDTVWIWFFHV